MRLLKLSLLTLLLSCTKTGSEKSFTVNSASDAFIAPDHIVFVWLENKDYSQIVNGTSDPYLQSLISKGTLFTNDHALFHPSRGNYIAFLAGDNFGITSDKCISGRPYSSANLYTVLNAAGKKFCWYSEDLPAAGFNGCSSGLYVQRHNPTTIFKNIPKYANRPLTDLNLDSGFKNWPAVACITPNLNDDMHNGTIRQGDTWIKNNLSAYAKWASTHNSVLIIYFDENDGTKDNNLIPVIAVGQNVKKNYKDTNYYNHYNWSKSIAAWYGTDTAFSKNLSKMRVINL